MRKYWDAISRMDTSTCIHWVIFPLRLVVMAVNSSPTITVIMTAWAEARLARSRSPAP